MERRNKERIPMQLICRVAQGKVLSTAAESMTENVSRNGILMSWLDGIPLPEIGSELSVEVALPPSEEFGQRYLRCQTKVVRFVKKDDGTNAVGLEISRISFSNDTSADAKKRFAEAQTVSKRIH
jgi:hypothetical protein